MNKEDITIRIKETLEKGNVQQKSLCAAIGVAASTLNTWLKLNRSIPAEYLIPICEFLKIDIYWLLMGEDNREKISPVTKETFFELTADEENLLDLYKNTTFDGQEIIKKAVRKIWEKNQRSKNEELGSGEEYIATAKGKA